MEGTDFQWFQARIWHQMAVFAALHLGVDPPEFHSEGDEDEVNSPIEKDVQDGNSVAP